MIKKRDLKKKNENQNQKRFMRNDQRQFIMQKLYYSPICTMCMHRNCSQIIKTTTKETGQLRFI